MGMAAAFALCVSLIVGIAFGRDGGFLSSQRQDASNNTDATLANVTETVTSNAAAAALEDWLPEDDISSSNTSTLHWSASNSSGALVADIGVPAFLQPRGGAAPGCKYPHVKYESCDLIVNKKPFPDNNGCCDPCQDCQYVPKVKLLPDHGWHVAGHYCVDVC